MSEAPKPPMELFLVWEHDLVLSGATGQTTMRLDSEGTEGASPMQALAFALAGCMAMDVVHVLQKGRHDLRGMRLDLAGTRAAEAPRRFTAVSLHFTINGNVPPDAVQRAIDLSREKYCSVWHSMRQDISLETKYSVSSAA